MEGDGGRIVVVVQESDERFMRAAVGDGQEILMAICIRRAHKYQYQVRLFFASKLHCATSAGSIFEREQI